MDGRARRALVELLLSMFSHSELKRFVAYSYPDLSAHLPAGGSLATLAESVVDLWVRHGLLGGRLWRNLSDERPFRRSEIDAVGLMFEVSVKGSDRANPLAAVLAALADDGLLELVTELADSSRVEDLQSDGGLHAEGVASALERWGLTQSGALYAKLRDRLPHEAEAIGELAEQALGRPLGAAVQDVVRVSTIEVRGFRGVAHLEVPLSLDSPLGGAWTCIAGINGVGKSSIAQAIALVLIGHDAAVQLGMARLSRYRHRSVDGRQSVIRITATAETGEQREFTLEGGVVHGPPWAFDVQPIPVLAYGASRNLSDVQREAPTVSPEVERVLTQFDPHASIAAAESLLQGRLSEIAAGAVLLHALVREVFAGEVEMRLTSPPSFASVGSTVGAADLPDGFRSAIAWLADICFTWASMYPDYPELSEIRAIVIVDEIDLHLHPSLQRVLVPRLRRALPKVQWIVTTHSPLIISSFDKSELVLLDRDAEGGIRKVDRQVYGFTADEVYRFLMGTEPRAATLEEGLESAQISDEDAALALLTSPARSEDEARAALDERAARLARLRNRPT